MSVLVSTAYLDEAAMCHDVYIINKGVILAQGTPEALTEPYKNRVYFARADGRTSRQMLDLASHSSMILDSTPSGDGVRLLLKTRILQRQPRNSIFRNSVLNRRGWKMRLCLF